jgi:hypothetical protein
LKLAERLRRRLQIHLARDWELIPGGTRPGGPAKRLLVIAPRHVPTLDYYLQDLLAGEFAGRHQVVFDDVAERWSGADAAKLLEPETRVVLVRMPSSRWAHVIEAARERVVDVVWLIDDDVLAARDDSSLPDEYRLRILGDYLRFKREFSMLIDRVWASTPLIAARFPASRAELRPPRPLARPSGDPRWVTIFYHGSGSHQGERAFLWPIFQRVQARSSHTVLEIAGDHSVYRKFRSVPRLRVVHPLPWPDYLVHLQAGRYDIGLVPLLDTPFNRARSGIKALEISAIGAQGILSRRAPYTDYVHLPGMHLVGDDPDEWVEQIVAIAARISG